MFDASGFLMTSFGICTWAKNLLKNNGLISFKSLLIFDKIFPLEWESGIDEEGNKYF